MGSARADATIDGVGAVYSFEKYRFFNHASTKAG
jgi:hypothetical protein